MHFVYEFSGNNPLVGSFGIESLLMDILILFVAILLGQVMALHFYTFTKSYNGKASLGLSLLIILVFVTFTFYPDLEYSEFSANWELTADALKSAT